MRKLLGLVFIFFGLFVVAHAQSTPEREIYTVLHYGDNVFEPDSWLASASEAGSYTTATWSSDSLDAVGYIDYLHYDDGIKPDSISSTFTDDWFKGVFVNYQGYHELDHCQGSEVTLYEFSVLVNEKKYLMRYWIKPVTDTRILTLFVVFPTKDQTSLDTYSQELFPGAITCGKGS